MKYDNEEFALLDLMEKKNIIFDKEKIKQHKEDMKYLIRNKKALGKESYKEFLEIEEIVEDLV